MTVAFEIVDEDGVVVSTGCCRESDVEKQQLEEGQRIVEIVKD